MRKRVLLASAMAFTASIALSACTSDDAYSDMRGEATDEDAWPSSLPAYASDGLDVDSARLVGQDDGSSVYLVKSDQPLGQLCLLIYPDDENWVVGCSGSGLRVGNGASTYILHSDGSPSEGVAISENVSVLR
jgi:hypothetical protein